MAQNQSLITVTQDGGDIVISGALGDLNEFPSSVVEQGTHKWIALDIATGLKSIVGATWNGYTMTQADEDEASSLGLPHGHIIYWAKADVLVNTPAEITITAEGKEDCELTVSFEDNSL